MQKIKSLELKRLLKELDYIESDFEYRNELISSADNDFINSINVFLEAYPELKKIYDSKITEKINQSIKKNEEMNQSDSIADESNLEENKEDEISNEEKEKDIKFNSKIKKLYREIAKLTHPDLVKNSKLNELYLKATKFYEDINLIGIYAICNELNIFYELTDDDISIIIERINFYKNKINFLESTYTWKWYNCKDESEKKQIIINYVKLKIK